MQDLSRRLHTFVPMLGALVGLAACTIRQTQQVDRAAAQLSSDVRIVGITTVDGQEALFDGPGAWMRGDSLVAQIRGTPYAVPFDRVERVWISREDGKLSAVATIGAVAAIIGLPLAIVGVLFALSGG